MRFVLPFLLLSACAGEIAPGEDLELFHIGLVSELDCGYAAKPCNIVGGGNAEQGFLEAYDCRDKTIWDRKRNSTTQYTIYGRGGSMFDNQETYHVMDFNLPKADPKMVALIEQAQLLDCRIQDSIDSQSQFEIDDNSTCRPATCIVEITGNEIVISKRP